jgi:hypothetical protein
VVSSVLVLTGLMSVVVAAAPADDKKAACEEKRRQCLQQSSVETGSFGVRSVPTSAVQQCGEVYQYCMGLK